MKLRAWPSLSLRALVLAAAPILFFVAILLVPSAAWAQGNPLGPEFRVNTYTTNYQTGPAVASDASGRFVVVWSSLSQDGDSNGVFGQRYARTGEPLGPEFRVNTYTTDFQGIPAVASDSSGNFVVVWQSLGQDGDSHGVFGQRYASIGAPLGPEFRVNTYTTEDQRHPTVASDSSGKFVVVWSSASQDGSNDGVFGQVFTSAGVPLGPEFQLNTYTTSSQAFPDVASDSSGNLVVVWSSPQDGSSSGVFGERYDRTGAPLGPEFRVNTYTTNTQFGPDVASGSSGTFVVVWQSYHQDGSSFGVFGQIYDGSGAPLGPQFRVNTNMTNYQGHPAVASDSSGTFVVVWQSYSQKPFPGWYDIFGQRYSAIAPVEVMHFRVE